MFAAALVLAAAVATPAVAGGKKDKKNKKQTVEAVQEPQPVQLQLQSLSDSVSYAAGMSATRGLLPYLQQQLKVDTAYLADFARGYREAIERGEDPAFVAYSAGQQIANQVKSQFVPNFDKTFDGTAITLAPGVIHEGFVAGVLGDTTIYKIDEATTYYETQAKAMEEAKHAVYKAENEKWLADNKSQAGVQTTASGLQYKVLTQGTGAVPVATDEVEVIYEGKTIDGNVFDATARHNGKKTDTFRCNQVIKGWTEALTQMPVGSKWEIYIPQELAYGSRAAGNIKPYSTLIFTVELVSIVKDEPKAETKAATNGAAKKAPVKKATPARRKK